MILLVLSTRKTTPGLREFEKFAVSVGGGTNHRFSLKDAVMIKDNHLIGNPNLKDVVEKAASQNPNKDIEIEVDTKEQLNEALETKATQPSNCHHPQLRHPPGKAHRANRRQTTSP